MSFGSWDTALLFALNSLAGQSSIANAIIIFLAEFLPLLVVGVLCVHVYRNRLLLMPEKIWTLVVILVAGSIARFGVGTPIRFFFPRPRPFLTYHVHQLLSESSVGFPSGHALFFFALSASAYGYDRKLGILFFQPSVIICFARVAAGIHYPSDILAGAVIGWIVGAVVWKIANAFHILKPGSIL